MCCVLKKRIYVLPIIQNATQIVQNKLFFSLFQTEKDDTVFQEEIICFMTEIKSYDGNFRLLSIHLLQKTRSNLNLYDSNLIGKYVKRKIFVML